MPQEESLMIEPLQPEEPVAPVEEDPKVEIAEESIPPIEVVE